MNAKLFKEQALKLQKQTNVSKSEKGVELKTLKCQCRILRSLPFE